MARYTGPKNRLSRREGVDLFDKGPRLRRLNIPPGQHGPKGVSRRSNYGLQLREKQKTRRIYGIMERQFRKYFEKARTVRGSTGEVLLRLLETRLDNVVYRLGFAATRAAARQSVAHGHVLVDDRVITIPSYQVRPGQTVTVDPGVAVSAPPAALPGWLLRQGTVGKVSRLPQRADINLPITEQLIVEYYSNR